MTRIPDLLAQIMPALPADPEVARSSLLALGFVIGAMVLLVGFAVFVIQAYSKFQGVIQSEVSRAIAAFTKQLDGLGVTLSKIGDRLDEDSKHTNKRFEDIDHRLDSIDHRLIHVESQLDRNRPKRP